MNALIVVPWDEKRGGVISVVDNLARHLRANGHNVLFFHNDVSLLLKHGTTQLGFPGARLRLTLPFGGGLRGVARTVAFPFLFSLGLLQLLRFLRANRIQIVNLHYPTDNHLYFAVCRRLLPIRLVTSLHGGDAFYQDRPKQNYSRAFRFVLDASDLIVLPSKVYRDRFVTALPDCLRKTIYIHNGIDPLQFTPSASGGEPQHGRRARYILCVAELRDYKGIDVLLRAAQPLLRKDPALTLVLAGDGPLRVELEDQALSLGIRHQTMFLGKQGAVEIARLAHGCEVAVLPSRAEAFGIALIEAMACRAPLVASRVGGIPEVIDDGISGLLVEPDNPEALRATLERVLADPTLRTMLATNGYTRAMERFCSHHNAAAYLAAFDSVLADEQPSVDASPTVATPSPAGRARVTS